MLPQRIILARLMRQLLTLCLLGLAGGSWAGSAHPAPDFTRGEPAAWINSAPLSLQQLRGEVVMIEFWTRNCGACLRSAPWIKSMEERFVDRAFRVVGIHTPEFSEVRPRAGVEQTLRTLSLRHPVMLDNDYAYWNALGNRYWPAFYLVDKQGRLRFAQAGEIRLGSAAARRLQQQIELLLAE